jgi:hypothetical protein
MIMPLGGNREIVSAYLMIGHALRVSIEAFTVEIFRCLFPFRWRERQLLLPLSNLRLQFVTKQSFPLSAREP